jgi:hypothetical protein
MLGLLSQNAVASLAKKMPFIGMAYISKDKFMTEALGLRFLISAW